MKQAILTAAFGTTHADTAEKTINAVLARTKRAYPDMSVYLAYTSDTVVKKLGGAVMSVGEALEKMACDGVSDVLISPLHLIRGYEYEKLLRIADMHAGRFRSVKTAAPLLSDADSRQKAADVMRREYGQNEFTVLMGHGTEHMADETYRLMNDIFRTCGDRIRIATVDGEADPRRLIPHIKGLGVKEVTLAPFMLVAGDHAKNDMSVTWRDIFEGAGFSVKRVLRGIGEYDGIRGMYADKLAAISGGGTFYGVGTGPGDPELLTVKAIRTLRACPVIAVPVTKGKHTMALDIVRSAVDISGKELISIGFSMSGDERTAKENHLRAAKSIEAYLSAGSDVAMINIGDPSLYSTYSYIRDIVAEHGFKTAAIAGVPSFCAAAAKAGVCLTERTKPLIIMPSAHGLDAGALSADASYVIMKPPRSVEKIKTAAESNGLDAVLVENCGLASERVCRLNDAGDNAGYFTTVIAKRGHINGDI